MPYRWICLRLLFLLVLLLGGLGTLRAEGSAPDSLSVERVEHIGAFDREKLERSFGLVRFRSSAQARYALDLGDESWYLGSVKMAIDEGAELWEVFSDGREILRGVYDTELKRCVKVVNL
ncbi:MAG: hypothetical protein SOW66_00475 [Porphyromonas sp.]|nr:hypothetical protein [Porphyromonas sp.]